MKEISARVVAYVLLLVLFSTVGWGTMALIQWDWNPANWSMFSRAIAVLGIMLGFFDYNGWITWPQGWKR